MQGILKGTSKVMENLCLKRPPLQIFAAQAVGQLIVNQYYSSTWKYLLYESWIWIGFGICFCAAARAQKQF